MRRHARVRKTGLVVGALAAAGLVAAGWAALASLTEQPEVAAVAATRPAGPAEPGGALADAQALVAAGLPPGSAAPVTEAERARPNLGAAPSGPLSPFVLPRCASATGESDPAVADAVASAAGVVRAAGLARFPTSFAGVVACPEAGRLVVYRMPDADFDRRVRRIADDAGVEVRLVRTRFAVVDARAARAFVAANRDAWAQDGWRVRRLVMQPDGTLDAWVTPGARARATEALSPYADQVRISTD